MEVLSTPFSSRTGGGCLCLQNSFWVRPMEVFSLFLMGRSKDNKSVLKWSLLSLWGDVEFDFSQKSDVACLAPQNHRILRTQKGTFFHAFHLPGRWHSRTTATLSGNQGPSEQFEQINDNRFNRYRKKPWLKNPDDPREFWASILRSCILEDNDLSGSSNPLTDPLLWLGADSFRVSMIWSTSLISPYFKALFDLEVRSLNYNFQP